MNAEHARDLAAPVHAAGAGHASTVALTQTCNELAAQLTSGLRVDGGVDRFERHVALALVGIQAFEDFVAIVEPRPKKLRGRPVDQTARL